VFSNTGQVADAMLPTTVRSVFLCLLAGRIQVCRGYAGLRWIAGREAAHRLAAIAEKPITDRMNAHHTPNSCLLKIVAIKEIVFFAAAAVGALETADHQHGYANGNQHRENARIAHAPSQKLFHSPLP
jgi:hypothetical protein